jgi:hypothetical protein
MTRLACVLVLAAACHKAPATGPISYPNTCRQIAEDIDRIAPRYAQLANFTVSRALVRPCTIDYQFHTHAPQTAGGWSSAVPAPDRDGIWFYIGVWDPNDPAEASSQINTQPVMPRWQIGERRVTFLVRDGDPSGRASEALHDILKRRGMTGP